MHLDFFPLLNAAAELGPILLFSEGFVGFDRKPGSEDAFWITPIAVECSMLLLTLKV
jgi:hypothetical protein